MNTSSALAPAAELKAWPTFQPPTAGEPTYEDWARLRDKSRASVKAALSVCEQVFIQIRNGEKLTTAAKAVARMMGWTSKAGWKKPARLWEQYSVDFSWKSLVDKRHEPEWWDTLEENIILPEGVKERFKALSEKCGGCRTAYELLLAEFDAWRRGRGPAIPGYDSPPPNAPGKRHPAGCSYANLMRHGSSTLELAAARDGREAALKELPSVRTTRVGSYVGAEVQFDDFWHNNAVRAATSKNSGVRRVLEFGAIDHYSGFIFKSGLKVRMPDENEERMKQLSQVDFIFYIAWFLTCVGYSPRGTVLNVENGTAAIPTWLEEVITRLTGGKVVDGKMVGAKVTIQRSGMTGAPAIPGQFAGRAKGNFRAKALKEGMGKLVHNRLSHLPGNVGTNFMAQPAKHDGEKKHDEFLMQLGIIFPELANDLKYALCNPVTFIAKVHEVQDQINRRPDHEMEGWDDDDLWAREFTFDPDAAEPQWQPLAALDKLPADKRAMADAMLAADVRCTRNRRLQPAEVYAAGKDELIRLPFSALPELLGKELSLRKPVERKCFEIGGTFFLAEIRDKAGFPRQLENGEWFRVFLNPFARDRLIVCDEKTMAYIGECVPWNIPKRAEADAIHRQTGQRERLYKDAVADLTVRAGIGNGENYAATTRAINTYANKLKASRPGPNQAAIDRRNKRAATSDGDISDLMEKPTDAFAKLVKVPADSAEHLGTKRETQNSPHPADAVGGSDPEHSEGQRATPSDESDDLSLLLNHSDDSDVPDENRPF